MPNRDLAPSEIPLKVLVIDADEFARALLRQGLGRERCVLNVLLVDSLEEAIKQIPRFDPNAIFVDPLNLGLEAASQFIFKARHHWPEITFVLFTDLAVAEEQRADFYRGERKRFSHYFKLDKRTPANAFQEELRAVVSACQEDSMWRMSEGSLNRLIETAKHLAGSAEMPANGVRLLTEVGGFLSQLQKQRRDQRPDGPLSVFVSYRFAEEDYIGGLNLLLEQHGFVVVTGKSANTFVSRAVLDRIKACDLFLCLMTRDKEKTDGTFATSPWLLEEKGAALAFGKPIVMMVEEGVTDFGGLQGDWQRIHFGPKGFLSAAIQAVQQLKSYSGSGQLESAGTPDAGPATSAPQ